MNSIGKRLRQERKRLKLTQSELGAIGGVEANAQGHYESGQRLPRADYLFRVAAAGVDITRVVTGANAARPALPPALTPAHDGKHNGAFAFEPGAMDSVVKIIEQLRQSLGVTADALCEITRLIGAREHQRPGDPVEDHLRVLQSEADTFVALALSRIHKSVHETH